MSGERSLSPSFLHINVSWILCWLSGFTVLLNITGSLHLLGDTAVHGPFIWGKDTCEAVYNAVVLEEVAERAYYSLQLNKEARMSAFLLKKHYERKHVNGIEMNTGSLGHGLSLGVGMSLAGKMDKKDYRVYVVMAMGR